MAQYILLNGTVRTIKEGRDVDEAIAKLRLKGYEVRKIGKPPSVQTMEKWMSNGIAKATDGCSVEPDGICEHNKRSWLLELGLI